MRPIWLMMLAAGSLAAATETLRYTVNWPSGLSLGEAVLTAEGNTKFELVLEASIPGFAVKDEVRAWAKGDFCSVKLEKKLSHGGKKREELMEFQPEAGVVTRTTLRGGESKLPLNGCGRDALTMIHYLRSELKQGRIPGAQQTFFGAAYQLSFLYGGAQNVQIGGAYEAADRIEVKIEGPASRHTIELFFGRDAARTPLLMRAPLPLGAFTMELQR